jgi:hypothetical protein
MDLWISKNEVDQPQVSKIDIFVNVKDDEDEIPNQVGISLYSKVITESKAYEWLISSLRKRSTLQWSLKGSHNSNIMDDIHDNIMEQLPTGTISKKGTTCRHQVKFRLDWHPICETFNKRGLEKATIPREALFKLVTVTCSNNPQVSTVENYMCQTWPSSWQDTLNLLWEVIDGTIGETYFGKYLGQ